MKALDQKTLLLAAVIGAAAILAVVWGNQRTAAPPAANEPARAASAVAPQPAAAAAAPTLSGKIAEKIDVTQYSYLRLVQADGSEVWTAVPQATVAVGDSVTVVDPQLMQDFKSSTLNRTFAAIYFGSLAPPGGMAAGGPNPHGAVGAVGSAAPGAEGRNANSLPGGSADAVKIGDVSRAKGPNGKTVVELNQAPTELAGKTVRVRGVVVKAVPGVLDRTFVHLRDGSGDAGQGTHDVTVTTTERPEVGQTVLYEGKVAVDKDFGSGYRYPVLLEDARSVSE